MFSAAQRAWIPRQLDAVSEAPVLILALSVPFLNLPSGLVDLVGNMLGEGNNIQDRWAYRALRAERDWFLDHVVAHADRHPAQKVVIVGGDIHIGLAAQLRRKGRPSIRQLVSSAISNGESRIVQAAVATGTRLFRSSPLPSSAEALTLIPGVDGHRKNPVLDRNVGLIEIEHRGAETGVRLSLMTGAADGKPSYPYRSAFF